MLALNWLPQSASSTYSRYSHTADKVCRTHYWAYVLTISVATQTISQASGKGKGGSLSTPLLARISPSAATSSCMIAGDSLTAQGMV